MLKDQWRSTAQLSAIGLLSLGIYLGSVRPAHAVDLGPVHANLCESTILVDLDGNGDVGLIAPSREAAIDVDDDMDGLATAVLRLTIELLDSNGSRIWQRSGFTVSTNEIIYSNPTATDELFVGTAPDVPARLEGYFPYGICEGWGIAQAGGQRYLFVAKGAAGVDGDTGDTDQTVVKVWIVDLSNGDIVHTHRINPQGGKFALPSESAIVDIDNDGDDELVVLRTGYLGDIGNRSRVRVTGDIFNLLTGALERSFHTIVNETFSNANAP